MGGNLDLLGLLVLACATAFGGGIIRDILIGDIPPASLPGPPRDREGARLSWEPPTRGWSRLIRRLP